MVKWINLTTPFFTMTYILNTIKLFIGHENKSFGPKKHNLKKSLLGGYPKEPEFQNSEYEVHQVGPKDCGRQKFSFPAFIGTELVSRQISATATARDRPIFFLIFHVQKVSVEISVNFISYQKFSKKSLFFGLLFFDTTKFSSVRFIIQFQ
jgi:hypothetical protein